MADFRATLSLIDRPHLPAQGAANIDRYKEWFHFNLLGLPGELDVIVNISLSGDVVRDDAGEVDVIVLCHRNCDGWAGGIERSELLLCAAMPIEWIVLAQAG